MASLSLPLFVTQLQQRYDDEFPALKDVSDHLEGWVSNWKRKAELLQVPAIQQKMNQQQVDEYKKEVKATLRRILEAKKKAFSLLTALKKNGTLLKEALMSADQTDTSPILEGFNDLTAKQKAVQTVYSKFEATVPKAEQAGKAIQKFALPRALPIQNPPTKTQVALPLPTPTPVDLPSQQEQVEEDNEVDEQKKAEDFDEDTELVNDESSPKQVDSADWVVVGDDDFGVAEDLDD